MIGLLGFGTVGQGVWEILKKNQFPYIIKKMSSAGRVVDVRLELTDAADGALIF